MGYRSYDDIDNRDKAPDAESKVDWNVPGRFDRVSIGKNWLYIRLYPGDYEVVVFHAPGTPTIYKLPYWEYSRHYVQGQGTKPGNYFTCLRSGNEFSDLAACPLCLTDEKDPSRAFAFNVLGLAYYHIVEKIAEKTKKPYDTFEPCARTKTNPNCPYCASKYKAVKGKTGHLALNASDFEVLKKIHRKMRTHCACGGDIVIHQAACPRCHTVLKNIETAKMSDSEFSDYVRNKQFCPDCKVQVQPVEGRRCTKCAEPRPLSMFDCNLKVRRVDVPGKKYKALEAEITRIAPAVDADYPKLDPYDMRALYAPLPVGALKRRVPSVRHALREAGGAVDPNAMARDGLMPPMDVDPGDGEGTPVMDLEGDTTETVDHDDLPEIPDTSAPSIAEALKPVVDKVKAAAAKAPPKGKATASKPLIEPPPAIPTGDIPATDEAVDDAPDYEG